MCGISHDRNLSYAMAKDKAMRGAIGKYPQPGCEDGGFENAAEDADAHRIQSCLPISDFGKLFLDIYEERKVGSRTLVFVQ